MLIIFTNILTLRRSFIINNHPTYVVENRVISVGSESALKHRMLRTRNPRAKTLDKLIHAANAMQCNAMKELMKELRTSPP